MKRRQRDGEREGKRRTYSETERWSKAREGEESWCASPVSPLRPTGEMRLLRKGAEGLAHWCPISAYRGTFNVLSSRAHEWRASRSYAHLRSAHAWKQVQRYAHAHTAMDTLTPTHPRMPIADVVCAASITQRPTTNLSLTHYQPQPQPDPLRDAPPRRTDSANKSV